MLLVLSLDTDRLVFYCKQICNARHGSCVKSFWSNFSLVFINASLLVALLFQQPHSIIDLGNPPNGAEKTFNSISEATENKSNSSPKKH